MLSIPDWKQLWTPADDADDAASVKTSPDLRPFAGLSSLTEADAEVYFGRDDLIAELAATIRTAAADDEGRAWSSSPGCPARASRRCSVRAWPGPRYSVAEYGDHRRRRYADHRRDGAASVLYATTPNETETDPDSDDAKATDPEPRTHRRRTRQHPRHRPVRVCSRDPTRTSAASSEPWSGTPPTPASSSSVCVLISSVTASSSRRWPAPGSGTA